METETFSRMHSFAVLKTDLYKSRLTEAKSTKLDCMPVMCGGASDRYLFQLLIFQKNISLATIVIYRCILKPGVWHSPPNPSKGFGGQHLEGVGRRGKTAA